MQPARELQSSLLCSPVHIRRRNGRRRSSRRWRRLRRWVGSDTHSNRSRSRRQHHKPRECGEFVERIVGRWKHGSSFARGSCTRAADAVVGHVPVGEDGSIRVAKREESKRFDVGCWGLEVSGAKDSNTMKMTWIWVRRRLADDASILETFLSGTSSESCGGRQPPAALWLGAGRKSEPDKGLNDVLSGLGRHSWALVFYSSITTATKASASAQHSRTRCARVGEVSAGANLRRRCSESGRADRFASDLLVSC